MIKHKGMKVVIDAKSIRISGETTNSVLGGQGKYHKGRKERKLQYEEKTDFCQREMRRMCGAERILHLKS